ncbi:MAG: hypothetical protein AAB262_16015, partial [Elusimicrobiota bacterium]
TLTLGGAISSDGAGGQNGTSGAGDDSEPGGGGSGGAINITAATLLGSGTLTTLGGSAGTGRWCAGGGGGGRIAVVVTGTDSSSLNIMGVGPGVASGNCSWALTGGVGTIARKNPGASLYDLTLKAGATVAQAPTPMYGETFGTVTVSGLVLTSGTASGTGFSLTAAYFSIPSGSTLSATGMGHSGGQGGATSSQKGNGPGGGQTTAAYRCGGGGYGGAGGSGANGGAGGGVYGSTTNPVDLGSGGAGCQDYNHGGGGGGLINLTVSGALSVGGVISSDGGVGSTGGGATSDAGAGGSGGTLRLTVGSITGAGRLSATGGAGGPDGDGYEGGGGGGGRIYLSAPSCPSTIVVLSSGGVKGGGTAVNGSTGTWHSPTQILTGTALGVSSISWNWSTYCAAQYQVFTASNNRQQSGTIAGNSWNETGIDDANRAIGRQLKALSGTNSELLSKTTVYTLSNPVGQTQVYLVFT